MFVGVGLSDTLGAFLAGLLLSETNYRYQIESDIAPFRGLLLGIFFITVGFSIDPFLIVKEAPTIFAMLISLIIGKASIITALSMLFGMPFSSAQQCGLLNAQGILIIHQSLFCNVHFLKSYYLTYAIAFRW